MQKLKKIILFGTGAYCLELIDYFGKDKIYALCDNSCIEKSEKYGIQYIPVDELKEIVNEYILILAVNIINAAEIVEQLQMLNVHSFLVFNNNMRYEIKKYNSEYYYKALNDERFFLEREKIQYQELYYSSKKNLQVLKGLSDIRKLNKATGYISYIQKKLVKFTSELFVYLISEGVDIRPFVVAGTALGMYRHNGFIPWDDDVDFGLMRDDYTRLINYGREKMIYIETSVVNSKEEDYFVENVLKNSEYKYIMNVSPNCIQIIRGCSKVDCESVDFFPYDYYDENCKFSEHIKQIEKVRNIRCTLKGNKELLNVIDELGYTTNDSNNIYFGIDSMDSYLCKPKGWIDKNIIFPLEKVSFEGIECYAPRKLGMYLSYCFSDYNNYPSDITCMHLMENAEMVLKKDYIYCGIYVERVNDVELYYDIYTYLRKKGIYCVYICNSCDNEIIDELINLEVEYIDKYDNQIDFCIVNDDSIVKDYEKKYLYNGSREDILNWIMSDSGLSERKKELIVK